MVYFKEENLLDKSLRAAHMEELRRKAYRRRLFNEQAAKLVARTPSLRDEVAWRVDHLNAKWELVEQIMAPAQPTSDQQDVSADFEHEVKCLRKWLREMESRLQPLSFQVNWTFLKLEEKATEHMSTGNETQLEENFELNEEFNRSKKSVVLKDTRRLWNNGIIPYEFKDVYTGPQRRLILQAMRRWEEASCIKFVRRNEKVHRSYLFITKLKCGCCSSVGKMKRRISFISVFGKCGKFGTILHELGHAIGFFHKHLHPDRDDYVKINFDTIKDAKVDTLNQSYNYDSTMHYSTIASSKLSGNQTIIPLQKVNGTIPDIGQRIKRSEGDILTANLLYNCSRNTDCIKEFLEIKSGYQENRTVIDRYFGKVNAVSIISNNWLTITFAGIQSEESSLDFSIRYQSFCGSYIQLHSNQTYYLESPNYPDDYKRYKLASAREGRNKNAPLIRTYCGRKESLEIASLMRRVYLMFFSDGSKQAGGFSAAISAVPV
ncbi:hypothetical protein KQX54_018020 [Cotesia glomerata]|uniref:Metalloendopeptidase n=1 Tax=Cotesia glomerata TaxID=32391 RepID=A0AAV7IRR9_COTGL|nr:hypothetical protein KQX54_018020 [Cotesia glomerata]